LSNLAYIALLSVYNKSNLLDLARGLKESGVRLLGSGGTAKQIRDAGIEIQYGTFARKNISVVLRYPV
jgi:AICAR transformylase/IMP cyclohydrolase PurH